MHKEVRWLVTSRFKSYLHSASSFLNVTISCFSLFNITVNQMILVFWTVYQTKHTMRRAALNETLNWKLLKNKYIKINKKKTKKNKQIHSFQAQTWNHSCIHAVSDKMTDRELISAFLGLSVHERVWAWSLLDLVQRMWHFSFKNIIKWQLRVSNNKSNGVRQADDAAGRGRMEFMLPPGYCEVEK